MSGVSLSTLDDVPRDVYLPIIKEMYGIEDPWSEDELNAWIDTQLRESYDFIHDWFFAAWSYYPDGARW